MVDSDATLSADGGPRVDEPHIAKATILDDRYEIVEELGRGAYGIVYRARDALANTEVAIKVLDRAARPTVTTERLSRELRAAWTVTHPGVVRIHDVIQLGGDRLALSMELVDGETLTAHLARHGPLPIARLVALARGLADALAAAHAAGVVHRDLKPSNIMIRRDGRPVISDFGLSRIVGTQPEAAAMLAANGCDVTRSGDLVGTPSFMAPEQLRGAATVGPAADMYAIGLVLYEAATGERLHAATTLPELVRDRLARPAPPVASKRPKVPAALARAIDDCLRIPVAERLPDGRALVDRLATRRRRWPIVVAIACAAIAGALALFVLRGSHRPELPAVTFATPPSGPVQWSASIPGTTAGIVQRAVRTPNGVRYLAGHTTTGFRVGDDIVPLQDGHHSGYVIAVAPDGSIAWHREVTGAKQAQLVDMVVANGLVLVAGNHHGQFDLGDGVVIAAPHQGALFDCYVAAFDAETGAPRWAVSVGASYLCQVHGLVGDDAGNVYLGAELGGSATFGGAAPVVHATSDLRGVFVAAFSPAGQLRWTTASTGMTRAMHGLAIARGGGTVVLGGIMAGRAVFGGRELVGDPAGDGFIALLDEATGSVRSTRAFSTSGADAVRALAVDATGAIAVGGLFGGRLALGDLPPVVAVGDADAFIALLAPDLTPRWLVTAGSHHNQDVRALAFGREALYAVGRFDEGLAFGDRHLPGSGGYVLTLGRDGGTRSLVHLDSMIGTRQRTVSVERDGTIGVTGTFRSDIAIAGATIPGPRTVTYGYAIELRPPVQGDGR